MKGGVSIIGATLTSSFLFCLQVALRMTHINQRLAMHLGPKHSLLTAHSDRNSATVEPSPRTPGRQRRSDISSSGRLRSSSGGIPALKTGSTIADRRKFARPPGLTEALQAALTTSGSSELPTGGDLRVNLMQAKDLSAGDRYSHTYVVLNIGNQTGQTNPKWHSPNLTFGHGEAFKDVPSSASLCAEVRPNHGFMLFRAESCMHHITELKRFQAFLALRA